MNQTSTSLPVVPAAQARRQLLVRQQLGGAPNRKQSIPDLHQMIEHMGFVQVDSVNTLARAHELILFSRNQTYQPKMLQRLLERDRSLFENWTHDASIIPSDFYPHWRWKFQRHAERLKERWISWGREGFEEQFTTIRQHVADMGPTRARDLAPDEKQEAGWWNWHPAKTALEYLWRTGELAVSHRRGFEKYYDLSERVIPASNFTAQHDHDSFVDWCCRMALARLGIATSGEIAQFLGILSPAEATEWYERIGHTDYPRVLVEATDGTRPRQAIAEPEVLSQQIEKDALPARLRVLSPFDPVLRDRKRAQRLFNFDYRIEIFVPEPKRTYGYYVFPLLEGDRMVGRIDMKRTAPGGPLHVRKLWWEPGVRRSNGRANRLEAELERLRKFGDCSVVTWATEAVD